MPLIEISEFVAGSPWRDEFQLSSKIKLATAKTLEPSEVISTVVNLKEKVLFQRSTEEWTRGEWEDFMMHSELLAKGKDLFADPLKNLGVFNSQATVVYKSTQKKSELKGALESQFKQLNSNHLTESLEAIFEELFMNATLDAPKEAVRSGLDNSKVNDFEVSFYFGYNDSRVFFGCQDPFGSLDLSKALNRMNQVYTLGAGVAMNRGQGGAGLGCTIMFEHALSLVMICEKKMRTFVGCLLPRGMSYRQRSRMKKSIICFEEEGDRE